MEKTALVLDASVIVKWFTKEQKREEAIKIRDKFIAGEIEIFVPDLVLYEISNALRYNPNFNNEDINLAIDSLLNMELNIIVPTEEIIKKSVEISYLTKSSVYDSTYFALAKLMNFYFITADMKLFERTKNLGNVFLL